MTSVVSADFRFGDSKMMLSSKAVVVVPRNRLCFPHDITPEHVLIAEPHAPYLPYLLPLIRQLFGVSIYFDDSETIFLLAFRSIVAMLLSQPVPMNLNIYTHRERINIKINLLNKNKKQQTYALKLMATDKLMIFKTKVTFLSYLFLVLSVFRGRSI